MSLSTSTFKSRQFVGRFVIVTTLFLASHLILFELFARFYVEPNDTFNRKIDLLNTRSSEIEIVGLGDSHTATGLNLASRHFFNFAKGADNPVISYFKFKYLVANLPQLRVLILQYGINQFGYGYTQLDDVYKYAGHFIDERVESKYGNYVYTKDSNRLLSLDIRYSSQLYKKFYQWFLGNKDKQHNLKENGFFQYDTLQYWSDLNADVQRQKMQDRVQFFFADKPLYLSEYNLYFSKILELAKQHNIEVYLISYPLAKNFIEKIGNEKLEQYYSNRAEFVKQYKNATYYDFMNIFDQNQSYFRDMDHLNDYGSTKLSQEMTFLMNSGKRQ